MGNTLPSCRGKFKCSNCKCSSVMGKHSGRTGSIVCIFLNSTSILQWFALHTIPTLVDSPLTGMCVDVYDWLSDFISSLGILTLPYIILPFSHFTRSHRPRWINLIELVGGVLTPQELRIYQSWRSILMAEPPLIRLLVSNLTYPWISCRHMLCPALWWEQIKASYRLCGAS